MRSYAEIKQLREEAQIVTDWQIVLDFRELEAIRLTNGNSWITADDGAFDHVYVTVGLGKYNTKRLRLPPSRRSMPSNSSNATQFDSPNAEEIGRAELQVWAIPPP